MLRDLKGSKLSGSVFNILFNLNKFMAFETRDPFLIRQVNVTLQLLFNITSKGNHIPLHFYASFWITALFMLEQTGARESYIDRVGSFCT